MRVYGDKNSKIVNDENVWDYCKWMYRCEKSRETVQKYRYYLLQFMEYAAGKPVNRDMVILWKSSLRGHLAPVTVNCALAAVNGFFKFCNWRDCEVKFLRVCKSSFCPENRELSKEEYKRLVRTAMKNGNERLALILQTICSSGIRISELAFITMEAVLEERAEIECKGSIRTVLLTKQLCIMLKDYAARNGVTEGIIFMTKNGKALDRSNVWREMKSLSEEAKVGWKKIFPHNLRHLFARTYYSAEKDLSKLADILGHKNVNTTRIYTMECGSRHREQLERLQLLVRPYNEMSLLL